MFTARGVRGEVWVHTSRALVLGQWSLARDPILGVNRSTVRADVAFADPFWSTQGPWTVALDFGRAWWIWSETICQSRDPLVLTIVGDPHVKEK